jgi:hypothetical protein
MSEKIFSGTINIEVNDNASAIFRKIADGASDAFNVVRDRVGDLNEATGGFLAEAFGVGEEAVDKFVGTAVEGMEETKNSMQALDLALALPRASLGELGAEARVAFANIVEGGGNVRSSLAAVGGVAEAFARRFDALAPVADKLSNINAKLNQLRPSFSLLDVIFGSTERSLSVVMERAAQVTGVIRTQTVAWKAQHEELIRADRQVIRLLKTFANLDTSSDNYKQDVKDITTELGVLRKTNDLTRDSFARMGLGMKDLGKVFKQGATSVTFAENAIAKFTDELKMKMGVQRGLIVRAIGSFSELRTSMRYLQTTWEAQGEVSERYLQRVRRAARDLKPQMDRLKKMHAEVPESMKVAYNEAIRIMRLAEAEVKRQARQERFRSRFRAVKDAITGASRATDEYKTKVRQAADANNHLLQFIRPRGLIHNGMYSVMTGTRRSSMAVKEFSVSLGSVIGIAGALGGALGQIHPAFSAVIVGASHFADQIMRSFSAVMSVSGTMAQKVQASLAIVSNTLMAFGLAATGIIVKTGMLGAEVKTLDITLQQIAKNLADEAGVNAEKFRKYIVELRDDIRDTGITTREATNSLSQFLRARLPVDKVKGLANAAKNLGVTVANMSSSEVFGRFIYFIQTGNSALLDAIGIAKNASIMYEEYAKTINKTSKALTTREKQEALIQGLIKETTTVHGVYEEAMKTAGKQLSSMKRLFEEATLAIGKRFEPTLASLIIGMNKLLKWFNALPDPILDNVAAVLKWTAVLGTAVGIIISLAPALKAVIPLIRIFGTRLAMALPWLAAIGVAISGAIMVVRALRKAWDRNFGGIQSSVRMLVTTVKNELRPVIDLIKSMLDALGTDVRTIFETITKNVGDFIHKAVAFILSLREAIEKNVSVLKDALMGVFIAVRFILKMINNVIEGDMEEAKKNLEKAVENMLTAMAIIFKNWVAKAAVWGWNLVTEFAQGMADAAAKAITTVLTWIGDLIGSFWKSESPPKEGPLSHIVEWGRGIMDTFLRAFATADFSVLRDITAPIKQALEDAVAAGNLDETSLIPTLKRVRTSVASLIAEFRETGKVNEETISAISKRLGKGGRASMQRSRPPGLLLKRRRIRSRPQRPKLLPQKMPLAGRRSILLHRERLSAYSFDSFKS